MPLVKHFLETTEFSNWWPMIILALLILLAIVCGYSWVMYRIKTSAPEIKPTVPEPCERHEPTS